MPYFITDKHPECSAWATVKDDGELLACHPTKQAAVDQMVAVSIAEDMEPGGEYQGEFRQVDLSAPQFMRDAAEQGLKYFEDGLGGDGLTDKTVAEARAMARGDISEDKWVRIAAWIARHMPDLDAPAADPTNEDYPSAGVVAHLLWGSGPSKEAAGRAMTYAERIVQRIEDEKMAENRAAVGELESGDYVRWIADDDVLHGEVQSVDGSRVEVQVYDDENGLWFPTEVIVVVDISVLEKIEPLQAVEPMGEDDGERSKRERETRTSNGMIEVREEGDGMVFEGYAAVFDSPSQPLPFIEKIERGAFSRSLRSRNDIKLLWNHDTSAVLGSTRAKTLTLTEDDRGLRVRGVLPNTTAGRDAAELLRRGDVDAMSFGFTVIKDAWSSDGSERTLKSVRLHEVSIVAFPAYTGTAGTTSVRNLEKVAERAQVDADALSAALEKVEAGEDITPAERDLLSSVLDKLAPEEESIEDTPQGDLTMLALKKKKLQLIEGL